MPVPASPETIAFEVSQVRVGDVTEEVEERRLRMTVSDGTRVEKLERVEERRTVLTVLAVKEGLPVRARVAYARYRKEPDGDDLGLEGRTFVLERTSSDLGVTNGEGAQVEPPVRAFVAKDFARFGTRTGLHALPRGPLRVGARAPTLEKAMKRVLAARAPGELEHLEVKLAAIRDTPQGRAGVFVATFVANDPTREVMMRLRAEIVVRARDGAMLRSVITGPMVLGGEVTANGTVRMVSEYFYR
jgi:hypothetical protein